MLEVRPTGISGLVILATKWHEDDRGAFSETYQQSRFQAAGIDISFIQDNQAFSKKAGTLRGLHCQVPPAAQSKLVRVTRGSIYDVAVDIRPGSPTYGKWAGVELSAANRLQFFVPAGFVHGYLTLEDDTDVLYKVDAPYTPQCERGVVWNDPDIGIDWPQIGNEPVIAPRDAAMPRLADLMPTEEWRV